MQVAGVANGLGRGAHAPAEGSGPIDGLRVGLFCLLLLFLNAQGDGFRLGAAGTERQLLLLPFTCLFCVGLACLLFPGRLARRAPGRLPALFLGWRGPVAVAMSGSLLCLVLFAIEARYYAGMGYRLHPAATVLVFGCVFVGLALQLRKDGRSGGNELLAMVLLAYVAAALLSIWSFPVNVQRSDMLPLLSEGGKALLEGKDPYRLFTFSTGSVFFTYLPGTLLAFVPASLFHVDLRLENVVFVSALALLLYQATSPAYRRYTAALLGAWLLSPYLQYRHEIYVAPHWLALAAAMLLAQRGAVLWASVLFGLSISMSQFSWILFPFFVLFLFQSRGWRVAGRGGALCLMTAGAIMLPFVAWSPRSFVNGVFVHWQTGVPNPRPINLYAWLGPGVSPVYLQVAQFLMLTAIFVYCVKRRECGTVTGCLRWMALALACFILLNLLIWGYFFLLLELLLLLHTASANGWLEGGKGSRPAGEGSRRQVPA